MLLRNNWRVLLALALMAFACVRAQGQGAVLHKTGPIQITANGQHIWCVNPDHDSVTRLTDGGSFYLSAQFTLPAVGKRHNPRGLAITANGNEVWVAATNTDRVLVLETQLGIQVASLALPIGSGPISVLMSPDGTKALVALHRSSAVAVFDVATRTQIATVSNMFRRPWGMCYTTSPNEVYVTHTLPDGEDSYVSVINTNTWTVKTLVRFLLVNPRNSSQVQDDPVPIAEGGYILFRGHMAQAPGTNDLWLPCQYHNFLNDVMTADSTVQAALHKINLTTHEHYIENRTVFTAVYAHNNQSELLGDGWNAQVSGPIDIAFSANGSTAYFANNSSNDVLIVPTNIGLTKPAGSQPLTEITVGEGPIGLVASPAYNRLFVLNALSRNVSVVDLNTNTVSATLSTTPFTVDPVPANVRLGAKLFSSSADPRLSSNAKVSCASCHPDGESDTFPWEFAQFGAGTRVTLSLTGIGLTVGPKVNGQGQFHRAGDRDELQDFDHTYRLPFMNGPGVFPAANPPLGAPNAGINSDADALAAFMLSLPAVTNSPYRAPDGSLTEGQVRGADLFRSTSGPFATNCNTCHVAPIFTDLDFHNVGGLAPAPEYQGNLFNTPSLVGAWDRWPYEQTASANGNLDFYTLLSVLRADNAKTGMHGNTSSLNRNQMRELESFLQVIDGKMSTDGIANVTDATPPRVVEVRAISLDAVQVVFNETVDSTTATDVANYALTDGIRTYLPTAASLDPARGNIVTLSVGLHYYGCPVTYTLVPGAVEDIAGAVTGGVNNVLDINDPSNGRSFTLNGTISVTFGDTGNETFPSVARDASFNSTLSSTSHASIRLIPQLSIPTKGFLGFDFVPTLANVCGVTDAANILDARFSMIPKMGVAGVVQFRRCLLPWNEPPSDLCVSCVGAVTRQNATHNTVPWRQSGARSLGGTGTNVSEYYPTAAFDVASVVDASVQLSGINTRQEFSTPGILNAFRFWFANPTTNFGYVLNSVTSTVQPTEFWANEAEDGKYSPVLSITFAIEPQAPADCDGNAVADDCEILGNPTLDANGNGTLDGCESGGCCVGGACVPMTGPACLAAGGTFQGIGVDCAKVSCPPPPPATGACCVSGVCSVVTEVDCTTSKGTYQGDNSSCGKQTCPPPACGADWNNDGQVTSQDFFDFIVAFFAEVADYNNDGQTSSQDFFDFITDFFAGC
ncbi:MAG: hypothetical protein H7210_10330 [Pyrinomonadaceae bacterium]|nr:hypothetical protein [Phycisphaerales bacterium]